MKFRSPAGWVIITGLAATGAAVQRIAAPEWKIIRSEQPALRIDSTALRVGQGITLGLLGGFRGVIADILWIRGEVLWEERDLPALETMLHLVTTIDPRPLYFWLNGARILAYDMPGWRANNAGGHGEVPAGVQRRFAIEQAQLALSFLDRAMKFHPASAELWIERANIELTRLGDIPAAAECYRHAWSEPGAPYYAGRLYAELLRRIGHKAEAYAWLRKLHPLLPENDEAAGAEIVLGRIRELERELGVPANLAYQPNPKPGMQPERKNSGQGGR